MTTNRSRATNIIMVRGITKTGRDFLRGEGEDEEKPINGGDGEVSAAAGASTDEPERLWRGGSGEEIF